jgi:hypothetical protein
VGFLLRHVRCVPALLLEIVIFHDDVGDCMDGDAHILRAFHGAVKVNIFNVSGEEFC